MAGDDAPAGGQDARLAELVEGLTGADRGSFFSDHLWLALAFFGFYMVLRPLAFCAEADLEKFARHMAFPIIPCDLCGSQDGLQRNAMKAMLTDIEARMPGRKDTMIRALTTVRPSHLLDRTLFDFAALAAHPVKDS